MVLFRGSGPSGELSWWGIVLRIVVLVGNCWALFLSGGELSSWGVVLEPLRMSVGGSGLVITRESCYSCVFSKTKDNGSCELCRMKSISNKLCMRNFEMICGTKKSYPPEKRMFTSPRKVFTFSKNSPFAKISSYNLKMYTITEIITIGGKLLQCSGANCYIQLKLEFMGYKIGLKYNQITLLFMFYSEIHHIYAFLNHNKARMVSFMTAVEINVDNLHICF